MCICEKVTKKFAKILWFLVKDLNLFQYIVKYIVYVENGGFFVSETKLTVEGRTFNNKRDYEAALRDKKKIDSLREKTNFNNPDSIMELYRNMQTKSMHFETVVGRDFDDEIYELVQKIRRGEFKAGKPVKSKKTGKSQPGTDKKSKSPKDNRKNIKVYTKGEYFVHQFIKSLVLVAAIGCIGYFAFYTYMGMKNQKEAEQLAALKENDTLNDMMKSEVVVNKDTPEEKVYVLLDEYKTLYNKNKNLIGWLKIDDTIIDYPIMQTSDNEYYLDHNLNQEYDKNGSLFLDKDCDIIKPSTNFIIYGHHMKSGKMFGKLKEYKSEKYYQKHKYIQFDTIYEKGLYEVMYVFNSKIYYEDEVVFKYYQFIDALSEQEFYSNMEEMRKLSFYDTGVQAEYGDQLLTLSTCDYGEDDARFVVVARKIQN